MLEKSHIFFFTCACAHTGVVTVLGLLYYNIELPLDHKKAIYFVIPFLILMIVGIVKMPATSKGSKD